MGEWPVSDSTVVGPDQGGSSEESLGTGALLSIGVGGMVGGGIFAVTGLTIGLTHGAAPVAFVVAGVVALLTALSYLRLTLRFPSVGGTVEFLSRAFGTGTFTGAMSVLLCISYVILLSVYAFAFGSYGEILTGGGAVAIHALASIALIGLAVLNFFGPHLVIKSENGFNVVKMLILGAFVIVGLFLPGHWSSVDTRHWVGAFPLVAGAMVIFLNYEGFELIANAAPQARTPQRSLRIAYVGGVVIVMVVYVAIAAVTVVHLSPAMLAAHSDAALFYTASAMTDRFGSNLVALAALAATASAINATYYGSGRLTYLIAKHGELPTFFERDVRNQPVEGMFAFALLSLVIVNTIPLGAIATLGSVGFLVVFATVNVAAYRVASDRVSHRLLAGGGAVACVGACVALMAQVLASSGTREQGLLVGVVLLASWLVEVAYRSVSGRQMHMGRAVPEGDPA